MAAALAADPTPTIFLDYGSVLMSADRAQEALEAFDHALLLAPGNAALLERRGDALLKLERHDEALAAYDAVPAFQPRTAVSFHNRGNALKALGRHADAVACFDQALALQPDLTAALYDRGTALAADHRIAEWFAGFQRAAERTGGDMGWTPHGEAPTPPHKAQHDREQRQYQKDVGIIPGAFHIAGGGRIDGPAVNVVNAADAARQWRSNAPQVVVVDNLLTDAALTALRGFCWGSTVWRGAYDAGYIGAFPESGFAVPLLAQIAEEFRTVFADICADHPLNYIWGFKYDSARDGIGIHADEAAVNINFWITPDESNLDPQSGGLVVWNVAAPQDWDFARFNKDEAAIRNFLAKNGATPVTVPYRANRAVIFDSDLFHQTDVIRFREGYRDRRINITLLYGKRAAR
jgi:tetratricopeptide (TPR) repeat protein